MKFSKKQEKVFEKMIIEARIAALQESIDIYYKAFNSEIFSLKIEMDTINKDGDPEKIIIHNHIPYIDISESVETVSPEIKSYLQFIFERYKVEQLKLQNELNSL